MEYWIDGNEIGLEDFSLSVDFLNCRNQSYRMIQISAFQFPQRHNWRRQSPQRHHYLLCALHVDAALAACFCFWPRFVVDFSVRIPEENVVKLPSVDSHQAQPSHMIRFNLNGILWRTSFISILQSSLAIQKLHQPNVVKVYPHSIKTLITSERSSSWKYKKSNKRN